MTIGERIRNIRKLRKMTLKELSAITNAHTGYLSNIESNKRNPSIEMLEKISEALDVSVDRLTGDSVTSIIENRLSELNMTLDDLAQKTKSSIHYFERLDLLIPDKTDYDFIEIIAKTLQMSPAPLRSALARQEPPVYENDGMTQEELRESLKHYIDSGQADEDMELQLKYFERKYVNMLPEEQALAIKKYRKLDEKGQHTVNTVIAMEYNRCINIKHEYEIMAAHNDDESKEELKLIKQDLDEL